MLTEDLSNRILALDEMAAVTAAQLAADRQRSGRPVDLRDTLIAGIAQYLRDAVQTDGRALVQIVTVGVIAPVKNDRNHSSDIPIF